MAYASCVWYNKYTSWGQHVVHNKWENKMFWGGLNGDDFGPDDNFIMEDAQQSHGQYRTNRAEFIRDKWYYHRKIQVSVDYETKKAYLLEDEHGKFWCPKSLIHMRKNKRARIYSKFRINYLEGELNE